MFSFVKKVDRNLGKKDLPKINDLKKTALFFGSFSSKYLAFKPLALMGFVGFRRQIAANPSNPAFMRFVWHPATSYCDVQCSLRTGGF
mgnify:CR=1 FL=1